jgi:hypothetical protein
MTLGPIFTDERLPGVYNGRISMPSCRRSELAEEQAPRGGRPAIQHSDLSTYNPSFCHGFR